MMHHNVSNCVSIDVILQGHRRVFTLKNACDEHVWEEVRGRLAGLHLHLGNRLRISLWCPALFSLPIRCRSTCTTRTTSTAWPRPSGRKGRWPPWPCSSRWVRGPRSSVPRGRGGGGLLGAGRHVGLTVPSCPRLIVHCVWKWLSTVFQWFSSRAVSAFRCWVLLFIFHANSDQSQSPNSLVAP